MEETLYARLGGDVALEAAVDRFYDRVLSDATLAPFFAGVPMERQRRHLRLFLTTAFGGPHSYAGRGLSRAHARLNIQDRDFDAVLGHLGATLAELGVNEALIAEAAAIAESTRSLIVSPVRVAI